MSNSPPIEKQEALRIAEILERLCAEKGIWISIDKQNKPELRDIIINISIRVK